MSEMVEIYQALKAEEKARREAAWNDRGAAIERIVALGFQVRTMSEESRHLRIPLRGNGWIDWWPSTGRWVSSRHAGNRRLRMGHDVESLIAALPARRAEGE